MNSNDIMLAKKNGTINKIYNRMVDNLICKKYSYSAQISIIRQKDEKPEEFAEFYAYAEQCKAEVKAYIDNPPVTPVNVSKVLTIADIEEKENEDEAVK